LGLGVQRPRRRSFVRIHRSALQRKRYLYKVYSTHR
jgi:hypothetical protein